MRDMEKFEGWDSYLFMKNLYLKQIYMKINNLTIFFFVITVSISLYGVVLQYQNQMLQKNHNPF